MSAQPAAPATGAPVKSCHRRHYNPSPTYTEAAEQLSAIGINPDGLADSGNGRLDIFGKRRGNKAAAYQWTVDGQALHWINFVTDARGTIFSGEQPKYSREEFAKLFREADERRRKQEAKRQALQVLRARQAQDRWRAGVSTGTHAYITKKQLTGLHNARIEESSGALLIPLWVAGVGVVNLQLIYPNGTKRFMQGARVKGAYSVIGSLDNAERVLICEGWATGASLFERYESEGYQVVVAFNAGNLMAVAQVLRSKFVDIDIVVAGDNDRQTHGNPGRTKAIQAAEAIGGTYALPELCKCCTCTDFNDSELCGRRCGRE